MKYEKSCGAVLFCNINNKIKWLIIKHKSEHNGHWDFPKGHMESSESEIETARREVFEECGLEFEIIDGFKEVVTFSPYSGVIKDVMLFLGKMTSEKIVLKMDELEDYKLLEYDDAIKLLTFDSSKDVLVKANNFISNLH
ncbi:MAG: bis(5'-nucleosyl)-tetraphosphatase [Candidatus Woesearchaeota archaeon]